MVETQRGRGSIGRIPSAQLAEHETSLLAVAHELFVMHGFDGTTVETIARTAHVSPKTIYARYGGKEGLFLTTMRRNATEMLAPLDAVVTSRTELEKALQIFGVRLLGLMTSTQVLQFQRMLFGEIERFPDLARAVYENGPERGTVHLAALLEQANDAGIVVVEDPRAAAEFFLGALQGETVRRALFTTVVPSPTVIKSRVAKTVSLFLRGLTN